MKLHTLAILAVLLAVAGCRSRPVATATAGPPSATMGPMIESETPTATVEIAPTSTLTPTPIPTLPNLDSPVVDPSITNPELFDIGDSMSPIPQFVSAMGTAGIFLDSSSVRDGIEYIQVRDAASHTLTLGVYDLHLDEGNVGESLNRAVPLIMCMEQSGEDGCRWRPAWLRDLFHANGQLVDAFVVLPPDNHAYDTYLRHTADRTDVHMDIVFNNFSLEDWKRVLSNWEGIKATLSQGDIPQGYPYDWGRSDGEVQGDAGYGLMLRGSAVFYPSNLSEVIASGQFTHDDILKLVEFATKARILRYQDRISTWSIDEYNTYYGNPYLNRFGYELPDKIARWIREIQPEATVLVTEDDVVQPAYATYIYNGLFSMLRYFKSHDTPVQGVILEDNLWVYDPPRADELDRVLQKVTSMGFQVWGAETTVTLTSPYPLWNERPARAWAPYNPLLAQADIYSLMVKAYLDADAPSFGFGGLDDNSWITDMGYPEANPLILDKYDNAKPAYYAIAAALLGNLEK